PTRTRRTGARPPCCAIPTWWHPSPTCTAATCSSGWEGWPSPTPRQPELPGAARQLSSAVVFVALPPVADRVTDPVEDRQRRPGQDGCRRLRRVGVRPGRRRGLRCPQRSG